LGNFLGRLRPVKLSNQLQPQQNILNFIYLSIVISARTLPIPGSDALNIFVLRDAEDANKVLDATNGKHVVIVGSSFIGMETASCIVKQCKSVTVLGMEKTPFERVLGVQVGAALRKVFH